MSGIDPSILGIDPSTLVGTPRNIRYTAPIPPSSQGTGSPASYAGAGAQPAAIYSPPQGYIPPGGAPTPTPRPTGGTINTPKDVRAALETALSSMIDIARTGKVDVDKVIGKKCTGTAVVGGPQVIIMNDPSGNFSRGTGTIDYSFELGLERLKHPLVYYLENKKRLSDIKKGSVGFKLDTKYNFDITKEISRIKSELGEIKNRVDEPSNKELIDPSDNMIKEEYFSFLDTFISDLSLLEVTMRAYTGILTDDILTEKFKDTLKAAIKFNDVYYKSKEGCPPPSEDEDDEGNSGGAAPPAVNALTKLKRIREEQELLRQLEQATQQATAQRVAKQAEQQATGQRLTAALQRQGLTAAQRAAPAAGGGSDLAQRLAALRNPSAAAAAPAASRVRQLVPAMGGYRKSRRNRRLRNKTRRHSSY